MRMGLVVHDSLSWSTVYSTPYIGMALTLVILSIVAVISKFNNCESVLPMSGVLYA